MGYIYMQVMQHAILIAFIVAAIALVLLLSMCVQLLKLNRQLRGISDGIKGYMDVICRDEKEEPIFEDIKVTEEEKRMLLSGNKEKDELIFNEVLQEIFQ
ncbi:MAG: hypothetical protein RR364_06440 [Lachnospiraceae bacterium]